MRFLASSALISSRLRLCLARTENHECRQLPRLMVNVNGRLLIGDSCSGLTKVWKNKHHSQVIKENCCSLLISSGLLINYIQRSLCCIENLHIFPSTCKLLPHATCSHNRNFFATEMTDLRWRVVLRVGDFSHEINRGQQWNVFIPWSWCQLSCGQLGCE